MVPTTSPSGGCNASLEERLERGEVVHFPACPFPIPQGEDRQFLLQQQLAGPVHKNISWSPHTGKAKGFPKDSPEQAERMRQVLAGFAKEVTGWLTRSLPRYAQSWRIDQVSFRPEEEATRKLRLKARNDLLHVDSFPNRPTEGHRILRFFVNINPSEPRVWVTSDPFPVLLARYGQACGLPNGSANLAWRLGQRMLGVFQPGRRRRTVYDDFMLRFHDFLKMNEGFQERGRKQVWNFQPGSAWMCFTDTVSHSVLRGRFALEHSYFVSPESLHLPEESPPAVLQRACGVQVLSRAA